MWALLVDQWHSSTRAELAGLVMAMQATVPIHVGIDNKAVVDKANMLITKAMELRANGKSMPKRILKKPWSLQTDGDLWEWFWNTLSARGADTVKVTKVKGHATQKQVQQERDRGKGMATEPDC